MRTPTLTLLSSLSLMAAPVTEPTTALTWTSPAGGTLAYRLLAPEKLEEGKTYPIVLFLHGAGERGADNLSQIKYVVPAFAARQSKSPCFLIAPQCPTGEKWVNVDWSARTHDTPEAPSDSLRMALELLDHLIGEKPADRSRIYLTGLSMGGYGSWDALARRPDFFAAAIPVCGGGDPSVANRFAATPIWIFHGLEDKAVPPQRSIAMWEALGKADGKAGLTLYPGVGHDSWTPAFSDTRTLDWLFAQKKAPTK